MTEKKPSQRNAGQFQPGQSGNPGGRPKSNKRWRDALNLALSENDYAGLREIADKLVAMAKEGDLAAIKEIGDRLDGKPIQVMEHGGPDGTDLNLTVRFIDATDDEDR